MAVLTRNLWYLIAFLLMAGFSPAHADGGLQLQEQEIKAGLLYNFLKYTEWPAAASTMIVCVYGEDPFSGYLQPVAGRTVNQAEIKLRKVVAQEDVAGCSLLFLNAGERDSWPQMQKFLVGKPVLTVSDFDGFAESGGMIEFGRKSERISVNLNIDAVTAARLHVQDRLLRLVTVVHPTPQEGGR